MSTTLSIVIINSIIILGVIQILRVRSNIRKDVAFMYEYCEKLKKLYDKIGTSESCNEEVLFIISHSKKMSSIMDESVFHMPILKLSNNLQHKQISSVISSIEKVGADFVKREEYFKELQSKTIRQIYNPFTLFYCGIELLMHIIFGYLITKIDADFNFKGKTWQGINIIISLLGGVASIWQLIVSFTK